MHLIDVVQSFWLHVVDKMDEASGILFVFAVCAPRRRGVRILSVGAYPKHLNCPPRPADAGRRSVLQPWRVRTEGPQERQGGETRAPRALLDAASREAVLGTGPEHELQPLELTAKLGKEHVLHVPAHGQLRPREAHPSQRSVIALPSGSQPGAVLTSLARAARPARGGASDAALRTSVL